MTIKGQLAEALLAGATVLEILSDRLGRDNRLFVKIPVGFKFHPDEERQPMFAAFERGGLGLEDQNEYWLASQYFCRLSEARKIWRDAIKEDRKDQLRIEELLNRKNS